MKDAPTFVETKPIANFVIEKFLAHEVDKVSVLFTHFINTINQRPTLRTLLPISPFDLPQGEPPATDDPLLGYIFEPTAEAVLESMLPYYLQYQIFQMVLDARASEHSARMVAMKNATDNAKQFIKDLTLEYNKMRQASITTELLEIATAQMALVNRATSSVTRGLTADPRLQGASAACKTKRPLHPERPFASSVNEQFRF